VKEDVLDIRTRLQAGRFVNEASISQGIVLRILGRLGWPTYDTSVVVPEYGLDGRRVDFALCHPPLKPLVFVEVKQPGEGTDADRQLFEYAFLRGVQVAILTTGQEWHFYLPAERGAFVERRVYGLDLLERDPDESVERLTRYLEYAATCSGEAYERARSDYRDVAREREIQRTLPDAWSRLVAEGNEALLALLADKVESVCGFKPEPNTVAEFLQRGLVSNGFVPAPIQVPVPRKAPVQRAKEVNELKATDQFIARPNQPGHEAPPRVGPRGEIGF
jgi:predicted type IV restriction endonuclease